ncbi:type II toxin-antitoxin system Phd/YefM family antitoxin [Aerophototrophica crusticola]|uniref:Antitoxin n=1 Tax=Aerophototrophica crusticola TaxID=1709002 RepID=A0A858R8V8_9PROT|nr:type II toxin-antitoxin system Phd/YefM family antitoxin [Rhodospirillaceae bacterium B3]
MMRTWQVNEARAHMRDLLDAAEDAPQRVTRNGRPYVVISEEEWNRVSRPPRRKGLGSFLAECPITPDLLPPRRPARVLRDPLLPDQE